MSLAQATSNPTTRSDGRGAAARDLRVVLDEDRSDRVSENDLVDDLCFLTDRVRASSAALANTSLARLGLGLKAYGVLALAASDARPTQTTVAAFLGLDASRIVALIDQLEAQGLAVRLRDPRNRRTRRISATEYGRAVYREAKLAVRSAETAATQCLTASERDLLRSLLRRLAFADTL